MNDLTYLQKPLQVDVVLLLFLMRDRTETGRESGVVPKRCDRWRTDTDLLAAFLEHVLLFLCHHLPLLAAEHHPLGAGDVLHVDHQLGAVQGVAVTSQKHTAVSQQRALQPAAVLLMCRPLASCGSVLCVMLLATAEGH